MVEGLVVQKGKNFGLWFIEVWAKESEGLN